MDEVNIVTKFTKGIIAKILNRFIKRKLGYELTVQLNEFNATLSDTVHVHLNMDADMTKEEFEKFIKDQVL